VRQVVATAGTALTEPNLKALSRFTNDVRLSFDADKAGIAATERAIPIASKVGVSLSIITIPSGKDPDELIKQSKETWQAVIDQQQYALDWLMDRYRGELDLTSAQGKKQFSDILLPIIRKLQDSVEQDHYMEEVARTLGVSREAVGRKLVKQPGREPKPAQKPIPTPAALDKASVDYQKAQNHLLALLLLHPSLRPLVTLVQADMLPSQEAQQLYGFLAEHPAFGGDFEQPPAGASPEVVQSLTDYAKILQLHHEELYGDVDSVELRYEVTRLQARLIEQYIKHQKQNLTARLSGADQEMTRQVLTRVRELDVLLKQAQQAQGGIRG
jgi:DNA primase